MSGGKIVASFSIKVEHNINKLLIESRKGDDSAFQLNILVKCLVSDHLKFG